MALATGPPQPTNKSVNKPAASAVPLTIPSNERDAIKLASVCLIAHFPAVLPS